MISPSQVLLETESEFEEKIGSIEFISNYQARGQVEWQNIKAFYATRTALLLESLIEAVKGKKVEEYEPYRETLSKGFNNGLEAAFSILKEARNVIK